MLFQCISYVFLSTSSNHSKLIKLSEKTPVLQLLHSPFCSHCLSYIPNWNKFDKYVETDSSIIKSTLNCYEYRDICTSFYSFSGTPSLYVIKNGIPIIHEPLPKTINEFIILVHNIKDDFNTAQCLDFPSQDPKFPIFVYDYKNSNRSLLCLTLQSYSKQYLRIYPQFMLLNESPYPTIRIYNKLYKYITINLTLSQSQQRQMILDYSIPSFHQKRLKQSLQSNRSLALVIYKKNYNDSYIFKSISNSFWETFIVQAISYYSYKYYFRDILNVPLSEKSLPALILTNSRKDKFELLPLPNKGWNQNMENLGKILKNISENTFEFKYSYSILDLANFDDEKYLIHKMKQYGFMIVLITLICLSSSIYYTINKPKIIPEKVLFSKNDMP